MNRRILLGILIISMFMILMRPNIIKIPLVGRDFDTQASKHYCPKVISDIPVPEGYRRVVYKNGSFAQWLRRFPLKPPGTPVYLYNKKLKMNQLAHFAVLDIDTGNLDLQQCADAVMRLRGEYLFRTGQVTKIHFNFTSGERVSFVTWAQGFRPVVTGNKVRFVPRAERDYSYRNFRRYLNVIFRYAGSASLAKELVPVRTLDAVEIGDVFIQGGFPGHAVIVVDMAKNEDMGGEKLYLLAQSYMPAQDIHILKNYFSPDSPWYSTFSSGDIITPEWRFSQKDLKRFKQE